MAFIHASKVAACAAPFALVGRSVATRQLRQQRIQVDFSAEAEVTPRHHRRVIVSGVLLALTAAVPWASAQDAPSKADGPALGPIKSVIVDHHPSAEMLQLLEVEAWPLWTCETSLVKLSYPVDEDCYLLEGDVVIIPEKGPQVKIKAGDFVTFPKGYACVWDVRKPVKKRYKQVAVLVDDEKPFTIASSSKSGTRAILS